MRHPPELLIYLVPLGIVAGIAAAVGQVTGSAAAWLVAGGAVGVGIRPVWAGCELLVAAWRLRAEESVVREEGHPFGDRAGESAVVPLDRMAQPVASSNCVQADLSTVFGFSAGVYGRLSPAWLLSEEPTAENVRRYLGAGEGVTD